MSNISKFLEERFSEIDEHLKLIENIERAIQSGLPRIGETEDVVTTRQQRIIHSSVYLQLYNLIEATVTFSLEEICETCIENNNYKPADLNEQLREEWVRVTAKTHVETTYENRLKDAVTMCNHITGSLPIKGFKIAKGGGGNWDDKAIENIAKRIGCHLKISEDIYENIKRKYRDELGALGLVVNLRNRLAHGRISFEECGQNDTASELRYLADLVVSYLRELVTAIQEYINQHHYLREEARPITANT